MHRLWYGALDGQEESPVTQQRSPRVAPTPTLTEAELSRIAREAVHQPADPRLDRQLARMGVMDTPEPAEARAEPASPIVPVDPALELIEARLRRFEMLLGALVAVVVILSLIAVALLLR